MNKNLRIVIFTLCLAFTTAVYGDDDVTTPSAVVTPSAVMVPRQDYVLTEQEEETPAVTFQSEWEKPGTTVQENRPKESLRKRYFDYSGRFSLWYFHAGYIYNFPSKKHNIELGVIDFRLGWWGLSPLTFEAVVPQDYDKEDSGLPLVSYAPSTRFFVPCTKWLAISPSFGLDVDLSYFHQFLKRDCEFDYDRQFYLTGRAGLSLFVSALANFPFEIGAEYRFPIISPDRGAYHEKGAYLFCRLYVGSHFD